MTLNYLLLGLAVVALLGTVVDVVALRRRVARPFVFSAVAIKAVVALMFAAWWVALRLRLFADWADLATMAGIMIVSVPLLGIAVACDAVVLSETRKADGTA